MANSCWTWLAVVINLANNQLVAVLWHRFCSLPSTDQRRHGCRQQCNADWKWKTACNPANLEDTQKAHQTFIQHPFSPLSTDSRTD